MSCTAVEASLIDLLYEELDAEERARLLAHLEGCRQCQEQWGSLRAVAGAADRWAGAAPPRGISERALARVAAERVRGASGRLPALTPDRIAQRVLLGAGAAVVSLLLVVGVLEGRAPLAVGVLGVLWTVLYAGVLLAATHERLRPVVWPALVGAGVALVLVPALSIASLVEACTRWTGAAPGSAPSTPILFVLMAAYTAVPLMVGGLALGRQRPGRGLSDGALLSVLYVLLIAPAVYLQCLGLPLDLVALWMAGAVVGAGLAGPGSLWLARWRVKAV